MSDLFHLSLVIEEQNGDGLLKGVLYFVLTVGKYWAVFGKRKQFEFALFLIQFWYIVHSATNTLFINLGKV